jgi:hypothetical protein
MSETGAKNVFFVVKELLGLKLNKIENIKNISNSSLRKFKLGLKVLKEMKR